MPKRNRDYTLPRRTNDSLIAQARLAKGLTQAQLAEAIGVKPTQIANWEQGTRKPKVGALMKIADALGIDWTTLVVE
jgi:transcriptional regulator with XRE-family HTH domain